MEVAPRYKLLVSTVYTVSSVYTVQTVFYTSEQNVWLEWMDGYPLWLFLLLEHLRCLKIRPYGKKINQDHLSLSSRKISVIWKQNWLLQSRFLSKVFSHHHQSLYFILFLEAVNQKCCCGRNYFGLTSLTSPCSKSGCVEGSKTGLKGILDLCNSSVYIKETQESSQEVSDPWLEKDWGEKVEITKQLSWMGRQD